MSSLLNVANELKLLERELAELEQHMRESLDCLPGEQRESGRNLVHYVALRQRDLRDLQRDLAELGLSSLGRSESSVLAALLEVSTRAHESLTLEGDEAARSELVRLRQAHEGILSPEAARDRLHKNTRALFGPRPRDRHIYVMVTAPSAKEADRAWMAKLLRAGMNVLRINCAHEDESAWGKMVDALAEARQETGLACRVIMDLAGPKIRTGSIRNACRTGTWKPARDELGKVTTAARVVIRPALRKDSKATRAALLISDADFAELRKGDELRFRDAREKKRTLVVERLESDYLVASALERAYVQDSFRVHVHRGNQRCAEFSLEVAEPADPAIEVQRGDSLILSASEVEGSAAVRDPQGAIQTPARIACTLPAALAELQVGERVLFDDGKILSVVESAQAGGDFTLRVERTHKPLTRLRAEKGINLPDTLITVPALTEEDRRALAFVVEHADAVSLSFVRTPADVRALHEELDRLGRPDIGVVLKIETRAGFENMPRLLLEGLRRPPLAVMIARGDLAVEVGFERLAELQEEMLWLCEAAHVPAIWATQVLDTLARTGVPSRAEVTDAAEGVAAECVMLNKGPYVSEGVSVLVDILRRMEQHRYKKRSLFRKLQVSTFEQR